MQIEEGISYVLVVEGLGGTHYVAQGEIAGKIGDRIYALGLGFDLLFEEEKLVSATPTELRWGVNWR